MWHELQNLNSNEFAKKHIFASSPQHKFMPVFFSPLGLLYLKGHCGNILHVHNFKNALIISIICKNMFYQVFISVIVSEIIANYISKGARSRQEAAMFGCHLSAMDT